MTRRAALLACVLACGCATPAPDSLESELQAARGKLMQALEAHDRPALESLLAEDFRFVHSTGVVQDREQFIAAALASGAPPALVFTESEARRYGDVAVWATRSHRAARSGPGAVEFRATDVLVREHGGWRWVAVQSTRVEGR